MFRKFPARRSGARTSQSLSSCPKVPQTKERPEMAGAF
jgi:hypothetical protein